MAANTAFAKLQDRQARRTTRRAAEMAWEQDVEARKQGWEKKVETKMCRGNYPRTTRDGFRELVACLRNVPAILVDCFFGSN